MGQGQGDDWDGGQSKLHLIVYAWGIEEVKKSFPLCMLLDMMLNRV